LAIAQLDKPFLIYRYPVGIKVLKVQVIFRCEKERTGLLSMTQAQVELLVMDLIILCTLVQV
jgi:hypothetical protein